MRTINSFVILALLICSQVDLHAQTIIDRRTAKILTSSRKLDSTIIQPVVVTQSSFSSATADTAFYNQNAKEQGVVDKLADSLPDRPEGVIVVRKPPVKPYIRVEYRLVPIQIKKSKKRTIVTDAKGDSKRITEVQYDTLSDRNSSIVPPDKTLQLGQSYAQKLNYLYPSTDTSRTDTIRMIFWINQKGQIGGVFPDSTFASSADPKLIEQIHTISLQFKTWGRAPGTKKKFFGLLHDHQFSEPLDFYCIAYVIVSSVPTLPEREILTDDQTLGEDYWLNPYPKEGQSASGR
jgi:hypothetical protein